LEKQVCSGRALRLKQDGIIKYYELTPYGSKLLTGSDNAVRLPVLRAFPAAFAIEFLYEAYSATQFASQQTAIRSKIIELADWLLTQQCTDPAKKAYGGFKSGESSVQYWAVDAGRVIPALLKAYALTSTAGYLDAAKLTGYSFSHLLKIVLSLIALANSSDIFG
jgi:hypothetical protein